ncbi:unnamed protein product [Caenorhabditis brenneri]
MAVKSFPILRLPSLARENVLKSMNTVQLFLLSQLSRRMKRAIKAEYRNIVQELSVTVDFSICISTSFSGTTTGNFFVHDARRRIQQKARIEDKNGIPTFRFFKCNILEDTKQFLAELIDVFSFPITKFYIDISYKQNYQSIFQWVDNYSRNAQLIRVHGYKIAFGEYCWILERLDCPNNVEFDVSIQTYDHKKCGVIFRADKIKILHGEFIRLIHLQSLNGIEYHIGNATINDKELNVFLRGLVAGANPNLRQLKLEKYGRAIIDDVLEGLSAKNIGDNQWSFELENGNEVNLSYSVLHPVRKSSIDISINRN